MGYRNRQELAWDATLHVLFGIACALVFLNSHSVWLVTITGVVGFCAVAIGLTLFTILIFEL